MSKSRGLGDDIKKITSATGLDKLANQIAKLTSGDCGCDERQEKLNKIFPYKRNTKWKKGILQCSFKRNGSLGC